jgi:hypothetical protein
LREAYSSASVVRGLDEHLEFVELVDVAEGILGFAHSKVSDVSDITHRVVVPGLQRGWIKRQVDDGALVLQLDRKERTLAAEVGDVLLSYPVRDIASERRGERVDLVE